VEDIAIFRALPRMTILAPADAHEMRRMMPLTADHPGPIYIRLAKGGDPIVTDNLGPFEIGKVFVAREGTDAMIVSTGVLLARALEAAHELKEAGIETKVLHVPTVKPLDVGAIRQHAAGVSAIVSVEEHTIVGGLGSAIAEVLAESDFPTVKRFRRIGIPDVFPDQYGSQDSLMARYSITVGAIRTTIEQLARA
jgi:transketolase